jgi:hypothetical protein
MALHKRATDSSPAMTLMGLSVEDVPALLNPNLGTTRKEKRKAVFLASSSSSSSSASPSPLAEKQASFEGGESSTPRRPRVPSLSLGLSAIARFAEEEEERKLRRLHDHHHQQQTAQKRQEEEDGDNNSKEPIATTTATATRSGKMNKMRNLTSLRLLKRKGIRGEAIAANNKDTKEKEKEHNRENKKKEKKREKAAMKRKKSEGEGNRSELMVPGGASPRAECDAKEAEDDRSFFQRRQRGHTLPANAPRTLGTSN